MKPLSIAALAMSAVALFNAPAVASTRHVTLAVPGMTCPSCPATLKVVLNRLPGVHVIGADLVHRTLTVDVVDTHVTNRELTDATKSAGYPSSVVRQK